MFKKEVNSDDKCYNCHKLGHFRKDYLLSDKQLNRPIQDQLSYKKESQKRDEIERSQNKRLNNSITSQIQQSTIIKYENNSESELFTPSPIETTFIVHKQGLKGILLSNNTWFLDLCTSYYLYNNHSLFINT